MLWRVSRPSVIARKDGEQVRLWARTTSDYSKAFTRIRDSVAALPVDSAVIDGEAVLMRSDICLTLKASGRGRGKQRRSWSPMTSWRRTGRTCALSLSRNAGSGSASCSRAATRRCVTAFSSARQSPETRRDLATPAVWDSKHRLEAHRVAVCERPDTGMAEDKEFRF